MDAAILTIGNEIVSGDTENTNASWLSRRLEQLGVKVVLSVAVPDELERSLAGYDGTVLLVTHDRRFLEAFAPTRTIEM